MLFLILLPCMLRAQSAPIREGDTLDLHLTGVPVSDSQAFNATYTVDQGMINLPLIQKVKVVGLLPSEIQELIQQRYIDGKYYTHPTVSVQQSMQRFVNVIGNVRQPQRVPYTADMTLMSVITACGGFDDYAAKKSVELMRDGKVTKFNTEDIRKGKTSDPKVLPGDQITVRPSFWGGG
jgi:polysaccharide biosynthesis/export protein